MPDFSLFSTEAIVNFRYHKPANCFIFRPAFTFHHVFDNFYSESSLDVLEFAWFQNHFTPYPVK